MMFSKKIEQLEKLSEQQKIDYKQPEKLKARLDAFKPFADFRSEIVHSEMAVMMCDGKITVFFENAAHTSKKMLRKQIVIMIEELNEVWLNMSTAAANVLTSP